MWTCGRSRRATAGAVGADLANLVNEAALRAVRKGRQLVNQEDLLVSFETVIAGTEKKNTVLTDMEKRLVAYHEVGHALVAALEKHSQPVSKITIVPHTSGALGYTMQMPEEEKYLSTAEELRTELRTLVGGRAAEQVVFGVQTTGAANDIQRATALARNMVTQYGMSEKFGLMSTASVENQYLDGQAYMDCSQETAAEVDKEVMEILQKGLRRRQAHSDGEPGTAGRNFRVPSGKGDHHRRRADGPTSMRTRTLFPQRKRRKNKNGQQPRRSCRGCFSKSGFQVMK